MFSPGNVESLIFLNPEATSLISPTAKVLHISSVILRSTGPGNYMYYFIEMYLILVVDILSAFRCDIIKQRDSDRSNLSNLS